MARLLLRPKAVQDLEAIWDYTLDTWGEDQAERYVRMIHAAFGNLVDHPNLGRACDVIRPGYRKHLVGRHMIFYKTQDHDIEVVRILHHSMDIERHL